VDIDDGGKRIEKSIGVLKEGKDEGVRSIVGRGDDLDGRYDNRFEEVVVKLGELRRDGEVEGLDIKLFGGEEIRIRDPILKGLD
ncbi:CpsB/CapC family capsule biosynthesis tyrosine phosphatase, partial [Staphylococcus aureus]|uniref:CpsB/CapC family capsule biosynthesis tyrosine phosphatase n=1 Tax=Staphylococcus aureus TaxID=1280 RepID=UPI0028CB36A0